MALSGRIELVKEASFTLKPMNVKVDEQEEEVNEENAIPLI